MSLSKLELLTRPPRVTTIDIPDFGQVCIRTLSTKELIWYQDLAGKNKESVEELSAINITAFFGNDDGSRMFTLEEARELLDNQSIPGFVVTAVVTAGAGFNGLTEAARAEISGKS